MSNNFNFGAEIDEIGRRIESVSDVLVYSVSGSTLTQLNEIDAELANLFEHIESRLNYCGEFNGKCDNNIKQNEILIASSNIVPAAAETARRAIDTFNRMKVECAEFKEFLTEKLSDVRGLAEQSRLKRAVLENPSNDGSGGYPSYSDSSDDYDDDGPPKILALDPFRRR